MASARVKCHQSFSSRDANSFLSPSPPPPPLPIHFATKLQTGLTPRPTTPSRFKWKTCHHQLSGVGSLVSFHQLTRRETPSRNAKYAYVPEFPGVAHLHAWLAGCVSSEFCSRGSVSSHRVGIWSETRFGLSSPPQSQRLKLHTLTTFPYGKVVFPGIGKKNFKLFCTNLLDEFRSATRWANTGKSEAWQ